MCEAITAVLGEATNRHRGVLGKVDLLSGRWCDRAADEASPEDPESAQAYFRGRTPESSFFLPLGEPRPIDLELTCRGGAKSAQDAVLTLAINGTRCAHVTVGQAWRTHRVPIAARSLRAGINTIVLGWPVPGRVDEAEQAETTWDRGEVP